MTNASSSSTGSMSSPQMADREGFYRVDDSELRAWVERLADELCLTMKGNFDHLVRLDVTDDTLEKLQMLVNFVLDNARRATEAKQEVDRLAREQMTLLDEVGRIREMGSYQLEELLGRGGMGEVWRGRHKMLARPVAIKLIKREGLGVRDSKAADHMLLRFQREARATAALRSPHTVAVYDSGVCEGTFFYVMELLHGVDLETLIDRDGPQPVERVDFLLSQACHSLYEAHLAGMVHRDVKPSNLFVCHEGIDYDLLKVLDFGLVKVDQASDETFLTRDGDISGTPGFLAPEQILGNQPVDHRADLYALGCTAYWLLTGKRVFEADNAMGVMIQHLNEQPAPLSELVGEEIPARLESLVMSCLSKEPGDRPQTADEISRELAGLGIAERWTPERRENWWQHWSREDSESPRSQSEMTTLDVQRRP